jgi:MFS family permease
MDTISLRKNIRKNYLFSFLISMSLTESIWMLFLAYRGMSLLQIGLLESIYHIFSLTFEMPTGMIADRFGRKFSRVLGRVMTLLSTLLMLSAHSFPAFALAFLFTALGNNLESGAGDALIYDTLLEIDSEAEYMKIKGRQEAFYQTVKLLSLVIGGWVATRSYEIAYGITALTHFVSILQALRFTEPSIGKRDVQSTSLIKHFKESLLAIWNNRHIFRFMLFMESFALFYTTLFFYMQNYMKFQGNNEFFIGIVLATTSLLGLIFSTLAHKIEPLLGQKRLIGASSFAILFCLFGIAFTPFVIPFFLGMAILDGVLFVVFSDYINQLIPSDYRATLLSFQSMLFSVMMIILFPIIGWIAETYSFEMSFKILFALGIPIMAYALLGLRRKINKAA